MGEEPAEIPTSMVPKSEMVLDDEPHENQQVYERFLSIISSLGDVVTMCDTAWKHFEKGNEQCSLEGREESWMACAIYSSLTLHHQIGQPTNYKCSLTEILTSCDLSPLEFFDKMNRWKEVMNSPRRLFDQMCRMQSSLSVSAVVFKRFLPIIRSVFNQPEQLENHEEPMNVDFLKICKAIWMCFLILKKQYVSSTSEDLISAFHLLLCITEHFVKDLILSSPQFIQPQIIGMDVDTDLLELMCKQFNGIVLDGKHLRVHWFQESVQNLLKLKEPINLMENIDEYMREWQSEYDEKLKKRGELDETLFLPSSPAFLFDPEYELGAVDELRRSLGDSHQLFDANFFIRLSTQGCLNRLAEKNPTQNTLTVNTEQSSPTNNVNRSEYKMIKLGGLLPPDWSLQGSELEMILMEARDSPINYIKETVASLVDRLEKVLVEEEEEFPQRDGGLSLIREHIGSLTTQLFYRLLEKISQVERERTKDYEFVGMFRKEELITSLYVISLEILLDTYHSERIFPWSIQVFKVAPISFYKIIEMVVKAEGGLSRECIRHINGIEESILEEGAWSHESPLWATLSRRADGVPSSESIWTYESERRVLASHYSPVKKRRTEDGRLVDSRVTGLTPGTLFFRKIYLMAAARLIDLCDRLKMDEKGKQKVWTIFEHSLRTETSLYAGRHLDQNILCIIYVMVRICKLEWSFQDIMCKYREQPQASGRVYRDVFVVPNELPPELANDECAMQNGAVIDLIKYYNNVFITRLEDLVRRLENNDPGLQLIPIPSLPLQMSSPAKKVIADRIFVSPLPTQSHASPSNTAARTLKYNLNKSPVKDLKMINKVVHKASMTPGIMPNRPYSQINFRY
ncbi:hypothetical protein PFISCL1PPCAC_19898 [Pristionchus fissidentatus]|uniref:Lin-35 n=1 Tax=Pristionchus fissidentatus TaxID=1538716 RepID=A0AAV5W9Q0_9BILA|nr:hypothetical protein PFISCL1PPCAC_19898 [Pristionchus fissidentatus]